MSLIRSFTVSPILNTQVAFFVKPHGFPFECLVQSVSKEDPSTSTMQHMYPFVLPMLLLSYIDHSIAESILTHSLSHIHPPLTLELCFLPLIFPSSVTLIVSPRPLINIPSCKYSSSVSLQAIIDVEASLLLSVFGQPDACS